MKHPVITALEGVTPDAAKAAVAEHCEPELDAILADIQAKLRRLDAEDRLDDAAVAAAEAELISRSAVVAERFAVGFFDALVSAAEAVEQGRE